MHQAIHLVVTASAATGVPQSRIYSSTRTQHICRIRWAIWRTLRIYLGWTPYQIAQHFGMDASNITYGIRKSSTLLTTDNWFKALCQNLKERGLPAHS